MTWVLTRRRRGQPMNAEARYTRRPGNPPRFAATVTRRAGPAATPSDCPISLSNGPADG